MKYYLYKINSDAEGIIYGEFNSLAAAKLSASLLLIKDVCFIVSGDLSKMYFYENDTWDYDVLDEQGKFEFLESYPAPQNYN